MKTPQSRGYVDYASVAAEYRQGRSLPAEVLARWGEAVRRHLPPAVSTVLDIGAGTGTFAEAWPTWCEARVIAVEPSPAMVAQAGDVGRQIAFVRAVAEDLPLSGGVDVVWASTALHHFADAERAAAEFARVLRPGGRVLVRTFVPGRTEITHLERFPNPERWAWRFPDEGRLRAIFSAPTFELVGLEDVLESTRSFADSAEWVEAMRHADSVLTALSDEDIATGLESLRRDPTRLGRLELSLLVFERHGHG